MLSTTKLAMFFKYFSYYDSFYFKNKNKNKSFFSKIHSVITCYVTKSSGILNWHQIEGVHLNELMPVVILNLFFKHL